MKITIPLTNGTVATVEAVRVIMPGFEEWTWYASQEIDEGGVIGDKWTITEETTGFRVPVAESTPGLALARAIIRMDESSVSREKVASAIAKAKDQLSKMHPDWKTADTPA